ncbi:hypothetical protein [Ornithinimicrobium kibberense]|uniref:hypothetical protein n=1 Tax=Ornithinimicrobium kibberense TaxID=282060 RepID=UPI00361A5F3B
MRRGPLPRTTPVHIRRRDLAAHVRVGPVGGDRPLDAPPVGRVNQDPVHRAPRSQRQVPRLPRGQERRVQPQQLGHRARPGHPRQRGLPHHRPALWDGRRCRGVRARRGRGWCCRRWCSRA